MDPSTESVTYLAPGAVSSTAETQMRLPGAPDSTSDRGPSPWPDPDDHLVEPETRQEMWRGRRIDLAPALHEHADTHIRLGRLIDQYTADGYVASSDLLTRRGDHSDFATDACIRKDGDDPETGHRHLEELSFEVFHTQPRSYAVARARDVMTSGVRRLFGVFVRSASVPPEKKAPEKKRGEKNRGDTGDEPRAEARKFTITVEEWSVEQDAWLSCDPRSYIHDPCLVRPLSVKALISTTETDPACLRGLIARRDPLLGKIRRTSEVKGYRKGKDEGWKAGKKEGKDETLRAVASRLLTRRFGDLPDWASRRLASAHLDRIERCIDEAHATPSLEALLGEPESHRPKVTGNT